MAGLPQAEQKRRKSLVPDALASRAERSKLDEKTLERAAEVRATAKRLSKLRLVTNESWIEHRNRLGETRDNGRALQLIMAATKYVPLPAQLKLHLAAPPANDDRIDKLHLGGIGTGKSDGAIVDDLKAALMNPGTRGLIVAPTYDQALHVLLPRFLRLCELMERAGFPVLKRFRWSQMRAELIGGGEVFFRSVSKVDNLLGFEFAWIHLDESETLANPVLIWTTLSGRLRQAAHFRQFICTSTPRGDGGVVGIFQAARENYASESEKVALRARFFFVRSTTLENPYLPKDYVDNLRRTLSKSAWDQEVLAKILRPASAVYTEFERGRHEFHWSTGKESFYERLRTLGVEYDLVYDPGETYAHVLWVARFAGLDVVFDELCDDGITTQRLHADVLERCEKLKRPPTWFVIDRAVTAERAWAQQAFPQTPVYKMDTRSEQSVTTGIQILKNRLDPLVGNPGIAFCSYLWDRPPRRAIVKCMAQYSYGSLASGALSNQPKKDNISDHGADCVRMYVMKRYGDDFRFLVTNRRHG